MTDYNLLFFNLLFFELNVVAGPEGHALAHTEDAQVLGDP